MALHSFLAGAILAAWARHLGLPSGRPRRRLLALVLVVPLAAALLPLPELLPGLPGRLSPAFRDGVAWLDSARLLELPVFPEALGGRPSGAGRPRLAHLLLLAGAATAAVTMAQELLPTLGRLRSLGEPLPLAVGRAARALPGWERLRVDVVDSPGPVVATTGLPGRPRLLISPAALELLAPEELSAVVLHEHAHWVRGRWVLVHLLFAARAVQLYNPVALWAFRRFTHEVEIACDRDAAAAAGSRPLARALLAFYEATDPRDVATRQALRLRVDALRGRLPVDDGSLPAASIAAAALLLWALLPWVV